MRGPEAAIKDQIRKWLKEQGAYVFSPVQMGYGTSTLDLLVCWRGDFVAIEVKAPKKNLTNRQIAIRDAIKQSWGRVITARSLGDMTSRLVEIIDD